MNKDKKISDLMRSFPTEELEEIINDTQAPLSGTNIKILAKNKRKENLSSPKEKKNNMENKKRPIKLGIKLIAIVAAIAAMSLSVFAFSQSDMMRSLFGGKNKDIIDNAIVIPVAEESVDGKSMSIQSVLTDGYLTNIIVCVENAAPINIYSEQQSFTVTSNSEMTYWGVNTMDDFSSATKQYFNININSSQSLNNADVTIALNPEIAPITLTTSIQNNLNSAYVTFPQNTFSGEAKLEKLQISPMGFLLNATESQAKGGLPNTVITVVFDDGHTEEIETSFDAVSSDDEYPMMGGGGAIIDPDLENGEFVKMFYGERNQSGQLSLGGEFARIIDINTIKEVVIDGVSYPVTV